MPGAPGNSAAGAYVMHRGCLTVGKAPTSKIADRESLKPPALTKADITHAESSSPILPPTNRHALPTRLPYRPGRCPPACCGSPCGPRADLCRGHLWQRGSAPDHRLRRRWHLRLRSGTHGLPEPSELDLRVFLRSIDAWLALPRTMQLPRWRRDEEHTLTCVNLVHGRRQVVDARPHGQGSRQPEQRLRKGPQAGPGPGYPDAQR